MEAAGIVRVRLREPGGGALPAWSPGAHIDLTTGAFSRTYSLCGERDDPATYEVAILREAGGRGGSVHIHEALRAGATVHMRGPRNHFRLDESRNGYLLVAGGIGITPIIAMADRLKALGRDYAIHYGGRSRETMAFVARLARDHGERAHLYPSSEGRRLDLAAALAAAPPNAPVYACGPARLLDGLGALLEHQPERLHVERFTTASPAIDAATDEPFDAVLADSGLTLSVPPGQSLLQALLGIGIDVPSDCGEGLCGTCEIAVVSGEVDHRDVVLTTAERREGRRMIACCSRGRGTVTLAL